VFFQTLPLDPNIPASSQMDGVQYARYQQSGILSSAVIKDCTFISGKSIGKSGGGIGMEGNDIKLTVRSSSFSNCSSVKIGGAISSSGGTNAKIDVLQSCSFFNNSSRDGGAIGCDTPEAVTIDGAGFFGNTASNVGGALFFGISGTITINASSFGNNSATVSNPKIICTGQLNITQSVTLTNNTNLDMTDL